MLCLLTIPAAWKLLSVDFYALSTICASPALFSFAPSIPYHLLDTGQCAIWSFLPVRAAQIICAALLVATAAFPRRILLIPALLLLWLIDTSSYLYRGTMYTLDTPMATLLIACMVPVSFKRAFSGDSLTANPAARLIVLAPMLYVATYYVLAGLAKFHFAWNWPSVVKVGNYYPISFLWHSQTMPSMIDTIARASSDLYLSNPTLDKTSSFVVLIEQFLWLAAPFSILFRLHAGIFALAYHLIVMLTTGIAFITWLVVPLAVTFPISEVVRLVRQRRGLPIPPRAESKAPLQVSASTRVMVVLLPIMAAVVPSFWKVIPPFHNYFAFGWRYPEINEISTLYRLGYADPQTGKLTAFPLGQGGFLDFRQTGQMDNFVERILKDPTNTYNKQILHTLIDGTRGPRSNKWLLGPFTAPMHLLGEPGPVDMRTINLFYLMKGTPKMRKDDRPATVNWQACGVVHSAERTIEVYESCRTK